MSTRLSDLRKESDLRRHEDVRLSRRKEGNRQNLAGAVARRLAEDAERKVA